jgi:subtilase family protein
VPPHGLLFRAMDGFIRRHRPAVAAVMLGAALLPATLTISAPRAEHAIIDTFDRSRAISAHRFHARRTPHPPPMDAPADPLGASDRELARRALAVEPEPDTSNAYVARELEARWLLTRLGINLVSTDRVHIDDGDPDHGGAVTRTAAGKTSIATGSAVSLNLAGTPRDYTSPNISPDQLERYRAFPNMPKNASIDVLAKLAATSLEMTLIEKTLRLENVRLHTPNDGKKTFVNMSWGETPAEAAQELTMGIASAPRGTALYQATLQVVGHTPRSEADLTRLLKQLAYPALKRAMSEPSFQSRMQAARAALQAEIARGRDHGILVFQAAGNSYEDAVRLLGDPTLSISSTNGIRGLITVGAVDIGHGRLWEEKPSVFTSAGQISVAAPGVNIPVGVLHGRPQNEEGTSFSSPAALNVARAMSAANPDITADEIARLITDPRAVEGSMDTRSGVGNIDPFAAVLLAVNPNLTLHQIDAARAALDARHPDIPQIRSDLGLR